jgi:response regulator RpfG family c-di-GMP phosphodiesterase
MEPTMTTANPFATLSHAPRALVIGAGPESLHLIEAMLGGLRCQVEFTKHGETPYIAVRRRMPDLIVMAFAADDEEACEVLSMLQLDDATRRLPVLACVEGEPCAIIPGEWPRTRLDPVQSSSPARYTAR